MLRLRHQTRWIRGVLAAVYAIAAALLAVSCGSAGNSPVSSLPTNGNTATWAELPGFIPDFIFPFTTPADYGTWNMNQFQDQVSLELGIAAAIVATVIGTLWGAVAGYFGGVLDTVMMRIVDAALAIPVLFLLIVLATIIRPTKLSMILIISLASWLAISRLVRGEALSLRVRGLRPGRQGHGRQQHQDRAPAHRAEHGRHRYRQRHLPGRRRDLVHRLHQPSRPGVVAADHRPRRDAFQRGQLRQHRILVADLPGRSSEPSRKRAISIVTTPPASLTCEI